MKFPLTSNTIGKEEILSAITVLKSYKFTMGKKVKEFEKRFSKYIGSKYSVMVNSGSSANLISIAALFYIKKNRLKRGDEILVPTIGWSTSYFPLYQYGLKLKFIDVDLKTLNYDLINLEKNISKNTKAILIINLLGNPNKYDEIKKIIKGNKIHIIEDNCESLGASYQNKKAGTFGIIGTNSFFFSHHISTIEGGMASTNNKEIYDIMKSLRAHGWTRDLDEKNKIIKKSNNSFYEKFNFILPGYNLRPSEINGAIGLKQIKKINGFNKIRRDNAKIFIKLFKEDDNFYTQEEIGKSSWFGFSLIIKNKKIKRDKLVKYLEKKNIDTRPIASGDFTKKKVFKYFDSDKNYYKNASYVDKNGFFIGNHSTKIEKELLYLRRTIEKFCKSI